LLLQVSGHRHHELDIIGLEDAQHSYNQLLWEPDIAFLTQEVYMQYSASPSSVEECASELTHHINRMVDLVMHKSPMKSFLEVNLNPADRRSILLDGGYMDPKAALNHLKLVASDTMTLLDIQDKYRTYEGIQVTLLDNNKPLLDMYNDGVAPGLVIVNLVRVSKFQCLP
jgi:hypothetical protein